MFSVNFKKYHFMKFRSILFIALSVILLASCQEQKGITINGNIENANNLKAYFDVKSLDNAVQSLANTDISGGKFSFNFPESLEPGIYRTRIGAKSIDLILNGTEKVIDISADLNGIQKFEYTVEGSPFSTTYQNNIKSLINKTSDLPTLFSEAVNNQDPLVGLATVLGSSQLNPAMYETYAKLSTKMQSEYPNSKLSSGFANLAQRMKKSYDMEQSKYRVKVGQQAPDIVMEDVNGKVRKLSDLKGQVVLLDFWASWCGPCRRANPKVVDTYHKYKDKGFTVFNVSLDGLDERTKSRYPKDQLPQQLKKQKQRWLDAIKKDNLVWDNHVSDLKKWDSAGAALYGVRSIPTTFLIDKDGNIAALNPNKNTLESAVSKLL